MNSKKSSKVLGIDLGTTNTCVAIVEGGKFKVIENAEGSRTTPSVVSYGKEKLVGIHARRQAFTNIINTISSSKRLIGRRYSDITQSDKDSVSYKLAPFGENKEVGIELNIDGTSKVISPIEVAADILYSIKKTAENYLGETVSDAVITVPAYFNDAQRQATKDAGQIAGLNVLRIINEPTAACVAYGLEKKKTGNFVVYDLGGGTFDVSVLEIDNINGEMVCSVVSTGGDTHLGGHDFDIIIANYICDDFQSKEGIDLRKDNSAFFRVKEAAEEAKKELSSRLETTVKLPFITNGPKHIDLTIKRNVIESLSEKLIQKTLQICENVVKESKINISDISSLILVGGMTRMPLIQKKIEEFFKITPSKDINPDECVAIGAAIQGSIIKGDISDIVLVDVTPLSLGIETKDDIFAVVIPKNTSIPVTEKQTFTTAADNQTAVRILVYQGERTIASANTLLGQFELSGIEPAPAREPKIEVSFSIDVSGIVHVSAKDIKSNKTEAITIKTDAGLTKEEINRMIEEAKKYKAEDEARHALIKAKNNLEDSLRKIESLAKANEAIMTPELNEKVKTIFEKCVDIGKTNDVEKINEANADILNTIAAIEHLKSSQTKPNTESSESDSAGDNIN